MGLTLKRTVIHPRDVISGPPPHWLRSLCSRFTLRSRPRQRFPRVAASRQVRRQVQIHSCSQLGERICTELKNKNIMNHAYIKE
ncbi:hypothetical protein CDAR_182371 [Caerostris darwini]|uniref:Uncharacterized protein n=1 Tax=Caerostris darwini TaxID=1538125 RepID=A0AAV4U5L9_9ARAC|nr:hypothetical protein CDAR_182371 [Caerostris darwini]